MYFLFPFLFSRYAVFLPTMFARCRFFYCGAGKERSVKNFVTSWSETGLKTFDRPLCESVFVRSNRSEGQRKKRTTQGSSSVSFAFRSWCHACSPRLNQSLVKFLLPMTTCTCIGFGPPRSLIPTFPDTHHTNTTPCSAAGERKDCFSSCQSQIARG